MTLGVSMRDSCKTMSRTLASK
ncbi:hypothetical protein F383_32768 [Gossypium arboreum]|uniref:Uncharacterized protein n=1 Tax=Gossypium arboreum TaxID=29729 RepID=A0A0B0PN56_GOSAR|nr:hypothetical protein F383_32768 [Gossypium arboreum]